MESIPRFKMLCTLTATAAPSKLNQMRTTSELAPPPLANHADCRLTNRRDINDPKHLFVLAVKEHSPQEVVGFSKWRIYREPQEVEAQPVRSHRRNPSINTQLKDDFKLALYRGRQEHTVGKAHMRELALL